MAARITQKTRVAVVLGICLLCAASSFAQFSGTITGSVTDPTGSVVPRASVTTINLSTQITAITTANESGDYTFVSLAPGAYRIEVTNAGFAKTSVNVTLETGQTLNVPVTLTVASETQKLEVTTQGPLLDTAETRNQLTLGTDTMSTLPLPGRSLISLVTLAPGAVGRGTVAGGSPGSGTDNYSTETQIDASANGQGSVGNMYIVDGLDVTSNAREGVANLTPNPDSIQEVSVQTNTFNVEYGRASSIQMAMTTKSGTDSYHGNVSDYYTTQQLWARTEFTPSHYTPFHSNNMSASIGGPIIPRHQSFFFFAIEPLWAQQSTGNQSVTFEDPAFTQWAQQNHPTTFGTTLLSTYKPDRAIQSRAAQTAAQVFGSTCGKPATDNIPCTLPVVDSGLFNAVSFRNGLQYNVRLDKYFTKDRVYGSFYRTTLNVATPNIRPDFDAKQPFGQYALQLNETHTFSPTTLNEAIFGISFVEGRALSSDTMFVPVVNVSTVGSNFGLAGPLYFSQKNYHWRDVLTKIAGRHSWKFGYEGWAGDFVQDQTAQNNHPTFTFTNILDLVKDQPYTETSLAYNPVTGAKANFYWDGGQITHGIFAQDTWKATDRLTINYGLRWDDFGNPHSNSPTTVFSPFHLGTGQTAGERVANGRAVVNHYAMDQSITNLFSPRAGIAWDPAGTGKWVFPGGAGLYRNWTNLGALITEYKGNPPGLILPVFYAGQTPGPLLSMGTSNTSPYGFAFPSLPPYTIDSKGGIPGLFLPIGSVDPDLRSPLTYTYTAAVERQIVKNMVATIGYSGSRARRLLSAGGKTTTVFYGVNVNSYPGDLIEHNSSVPARLNTSFGSITYTTNDRESDYNALILSVRGRFVKRGFFSASYTRSASQDDAQTYPTWQNPRQYYGPSIWDVPHRFSLVWNYQLPEFRQGHGLTGRVLGGWSLSGTTILQSGTPFTVVNGQPFKPTYDQNGKINGIATTSGDYNADGDNNDYPNVTSYTTANSRDAYLNTGLFTEKNAAGQYAYGYANFPLPQLGQEGNEKFNGFRNPGFAQTDFAILKNTRIRERANLQFRVEFYNLFNHPNLGPVNTAIPQATFGRVTSQLLPRWIQLGVNLRF